MEIIVTTEKKLVDVPVKKYKAFDGYIFDHEADCQAYERMLLIKQIPDTSKFPALDDVRPFNGGDNIEDHTYLWYFVDSPETMDKLNQAYGGMDQLTNAVGEYICVEIDYDGYAWFYELDNMLKYVNSILSELHVTYDQLTKDNKEGKINHGKEN